MSSHVPTYERLFALLKPLLTEYVDANADRDNTKVVEFVPAAELAAKLSPAFSQAGKDDAALVADIAHVLQYSVRTSHPYFFDKLYAGSDPVGVLAEGITALLNTNVHTYAVAPVFSVLEVSCVQQLGRLMGFPDADGVMCPGGTYANTVAMLTARHKHFPHVKLDGYRDGERPVVFTSAQAHYSIKTAAVMLGLGMNACIAIGTDREGRMDPAQLDAALTAARARGQTPFFVNATAGTTVLGAFDDLDAIADVCAAHGVWMHVDASWGGALAVLPEAEQDGLLNGTARAASLTWNPHKALGAPNQCSVLMVNDDSTNKTLLPAAMSLSVEYLYHAHPEADYDLGRKTPQCGRHGDALKLWLYINHHGLDGLAARIRTARSNVAHLVALINARPHAFHLVRTPRYLNCGFWFVPPSLRTDEARALPLEKQQVKWSAAVAPVYRRMQQTGRLLVNYNPLPDGTPTFFRIIVMNPGLTHDDMREVLDRIEDLGSDL